MPPVNPQYNVNIPAQAVSPTLPGTQAIPQASTSYEYRDLAETYGSIIKELTDTEKLIEDFELRLRGKMKDQAGNVIDDPKREPRIKNDRAAADFIDIVRGVVNRHTDFSSYSDLEAFGIIEGATIVICRWLMFQGEDVPLRYRDKITFEALSLISASLHKAIDGKMLRWTKGSFSEGRNISEQPGNKKSLLDYIPFMPRRAR